MKDKVFEFIQQKLIKSSSGLALTYTIGHMVIAMMCTYFITGSSLNLAALNALVEPCFNGVWFYILHKIYRYYSSIKGNLG